MKSKIFLIVYAIVIAAITAGLVFFMILHIRKGLAGGNEKLILGAYIMMIIWARMKLHAAIKSIRERNEDQ